MYMCFFASLQFITEKGSGEILIVGQMCAAEVGKNPENLARIWRAKSCYSMHAFSFRLLFFSLKYNAIKYPFEIRFC